MENAYSDGSTTGWWHRDRVIVALLVVILAVGYFVTGGSMSMRGEETRRGQVAVEIIESGDWVVPREQGDLFFSRPPLQNWLIAACYLVSGSRDALGARLPSFVAIVLMSLILYGYGRTFMSPTGAFAAAAAFATFGEVMQEGRTAETEAVFTFFVGASLLVWHWGMIRNWGDTLTWSLAYGLVALGMLAKSLQAPFYFVVSVFIFLILTRQWRRLFSLSHLAGMCVGAAVLAAWVIPYARELGIDTVRRIWMNDVAQRIFEWQGLLKHLVQFPVELFGCLLPWSPLLLAFCHRKMRAAIGVQCPQAMFAVVILVFGVPTVWFPPHGATRYLMPLYPIFAVLVGFVVERCAAPTVDAASAAGWRSYLLVMAGLMGMIGVALPVASVFSEVHLVGYWSDPPLLGGAFCVVFLVLAWRTRQAALATSLPAQATVGVLAIAAFMAIFFAGPLNNMRIRRGNDVGAEIAKLKADIPSDATFVSIGHVYSEFPFFYGQPVKPIAASGVHEISEGTYFCFDAIGKSRPTLPFAWEEIRVIAVDRNKQPEPFEVLVIGRRLPSRNQIAIKG